MINPYALGHMINHPPPDTPANCLLIDFDLPYVFFPSLFTRYIPYINYREEQKTKKTSETRGGDVFRAVAVVSATTLAHGEELYVDYLKEELYPSIPATHYGDKRLIAQYFKDFFVSLFGNSYPSSF